MCLVLFSLIIFLFYLAVVRISALLISVHGTLNNLLKTHFSCSDGVLCAFIYLVSMIHTFRVLTLNCYIAGNDVQGIDQVVYNIYGREVESTIAARKAMQQLVTKEHTHGSDTAKSTDDSLTSGVGSIQLPVNWSPMADEEMKLEVLSPSSKEFEIVENAFRESAGIGVNGISKVGAFLQVHPRVLSTV